MVGTIPSKLYVVSSVKFSNHDTLTATSYWLHLVPPADTHSLGVPTGRVFLVNIKEIIWVFFN